MWRFRIFWVAYFLLISSLFLHPVDSGDFFHHLNTGRYIFEHWQLPRSDDLTFTAFGKHWVAYGWGSGVVYYIIFNLFGYYGISLLFALFGFLSCLFLLLSLEKLKIGLRVRVVFTALAAAIASLRWPSRPEVLGPVFITFLIYLLLVWKKHLKFLPLLFGLWGIVYGASAFLGIIVFGFWILTSRSFNRKTLVIFCLSIVFSILNGYGLSSFLYVFQMPKISPRIGEWLPLLATMNKAMPDLVLFYQYIVLTYLLFVMFYLVLLVLNLVRRGKKFVKANLFILGISFFIFIPFYSNRFINLAVFAGMLAVAVLWTKNYPRLKKITLIWVLIILLLAVFTRFDKFSFGLHMDNWPFQMKVVDFMKIKNIKGNIFASQEIGSFLSWYLPESKVFVDTRDDLFTSTDVFKDLDKLGMGEVDILELLGKYQANIIIGRISSGRIYKQIFYSDNWSVVFITDGYFVAIKKEDFKNVEGKIVAVDPYSRPPAKPGQIDLAERELERMVLADSGVLGNKLRLVEIKLTKNQAQEAEAIFNTIKYSHRTQITDKMGILEIAGRIYLAERNCKSAFDTFAKVDNLSRHQLIFFPDVRLPTDIDGYLEQYYQRCTKL